MLQRLSFNFWYFRHPPWDSGISPPELFEFIKTHPSGRAIDLGCGTGTNSITLARHGWQVTGVDFALRAIKTAKRKAKKSNVKIDLRVGDVTKLNGIHGPFDLALDIGCFHGLGKKKADYLQRVDEILAPGGFWLMYGFFKSARDAPGPGLAEADLKIAASRFNLISRTDSLDKKGRNAVWVLFQKST